MLYTEFIGPESRRRCHGPSTSRDAHRHARDTAPALHPLDLCQHTCYCTVYTRHASTHMMSHSIHTHAHRETRAHMRHISHGAPAMPLPRVGCGLCTWSTWEASSTPLLGGKFHSSLIWEASSTPPPLKPPLHVGLPRTLPGLILPVAGDATETSIGHTTAVSRDGSRSTNWRC